MKSNKPFVSSEAVIQLLDPVRIYTAKELAVMPLSVMNTAIEAQEAYFIMEQSTKMGGASDSNTPSIAKRCQVNSDKRKVTHTLQDRQRICRASTHSTIRKARISQIGWGC